MLRTWSLPARWFHFLAGRSGPAASAAPASAHRPRRPCLLPGTEDFWLALTSCHLPESVWSLLEEGLRLAARTRAYRGQTGKLWPDERPGEVIEWRRFGVHGEELVPRATSDVAGGISTELKRTVHTLEAPGLSRQERQRRLVLHGARLGQMYDELARRAGPRAPLDEIRRALAALLA